MGKRGIGTLFRASKFAGGDKVVTTHVIHLTSKKPDKRISNFKLVFAGIGQPVMAKNYLQLARKSERIFQGVG